MTQEELIAHLEHLAEYVKYSEDAPALREVIEMLKCSEMPNSSEKRTEERAETHACDLISRQAAIDALHMHLMYRMGTDSNKKRLDEWINNLPSAQLEIIRCKDCKYQDEGYRRISVKWLPCMDIHPGSNWYCGSAERREE